MKRILLALASTCVAASLMAQGTATGGLITFKTKGTAPSGAFAAQVSLVDRAGVALSAADSAMWLQSGNWYMELWLQEGTFALTGQRNGAGATDAIVREQMSVTATGMGYVSASTRDWSLNNVAQGVQASFRLVAYFAPTGTETWSTLANLDPTQVIGGWSAPFTVAPGGNQLAPPQTPAFFTTASGWTVAVPEPSVLALGLLGMGAFLIRRRS